jgi:hypothetical protein
MKIISIRGTHGSGKSWVARQVMARLGEPVDIRYQDGGKKVSGTLRGTASPLLFVVGGYREGVSTGGCDTIKDIRVTEQIVLGAANEGHHVLYEGARAGAGHSKWIKIGWDNKQHEWHFIVLDTPVDRCFENIRARRVLAGLPPADEEKIGVGVNDLWRRSRRQIYHFREAHFPVDLLSTEAAVERVLEIIGFAR